MGLISLLITLLVLCLIFGVIYWLIGLVVSALPPPVKAPGSLILYILFAIIVICCLLDLLGVLGTRHIILVPLR